MLLSHWFNKLIEALLYLHAYSSIFKFPKITNNGVTNVRIAAWKVVNIAIIEIANNKSLKGELLFALNE